MANTASVLAKATLSTLATLYTVGGGKTAILKSFDIANFSNGTVEVHVYVVDDTDTAVDGDHLICETVPGKSSYGWEGEQVLTAGMTLQASASPASACTLRASGIEIS